MRTHTDSQGVPVDSVLPEFFSILIGWLDAGTSPSGQRYGTGGNLTSDAHLAALPIEHGAELCSCDSDFARFPGLKWNNPLA